MRIALVHDWLTESGEKEKFLFAFMELFPDAEIFTLVYRPEAFDGQFEGRRITTSYLQRLPFGKTRFRSYLPLYWGLMGGFNLAGYDLIVSSHSICAKWVRNPSKALHVCYFHSCVNHLWENAAGERVEGFPRWQARFFRDYLTRCDIRSNGGVAHFLAGSEEMRDPIRRLYGREAEVIPPPVDAKFLFKMQVYFRRLFGIPVLEDNLRV